mgnify:CR=1 FL=1
MPDFEYTARELDGKAVSGVVTAANRHDALRTLVTRNLFPMHVETRKEAASLSQLARPRVSQAQLVTFYTQLSDLLKAGVALLRALELLERQTSNRSFQKVLQDVRGRVADGARLTQALRQHPSVFGELAVSMIRAGEEGGFLEDVLRRIASFTEHQQELKNRVVGAMVYPAFLTIAMSLVVTGMLVFFVPKFEPVFARLSERGELPWATTALMSLSDSAKDYWPMAAIALAVGFVVIHRWSQTPAGKLRLDEWRLRSIGVGPIVHSLAISRFCRILGTLLRSGVPILPSMNIAKDAMGNIVLSQAVASAAENISEGKSLAGPLAASRRFPPEVVEMISVGEEANNLEQVLIDVADSMERRTNRLLEMFVRLLEPILLTVMAGVVLFVVIALLWPIMQSSSVI